MPDSQRIDPVLVQKAAKAIYEARRPALERLNPQSYFQRWDELQSESMRDQAIAEGQAVVDELGLKEGKRYVCENCKRLGTMADFQDECSRGWTHGRLIGPLVDVPSSRFRAETNAEMQQRLLRESSVGRPVEQGDADGD